MRRPKHTTSKARTEAAYFRCVLRRVGRNVCDEVARWVNAEWVRWHQEREDCINGIAPFPKPPFA